MNIIKLTRLNGKAAYVKDGLISCMLERDECTDVYLLGDPTPLSVEETPEQIISLLLD